MYQATHPKYGKKALLKAMMRVLPCATQEGSNHVPFWREELKIRIKLQHLTWENDNFSVNNVTRLLNWSIQSVRYLVIHLYKNINNLFKNHWQESCCHSSLCETKAHDVISCGL